MTPTKFLLVPLLMLAAVIAQASEYTYDAKTKLYWKEGVAYVLKYRWEYKTYCDGYGCCYQKRVSVGYYEPADVRTIYQEKVVKGGASVVELVADLARQRDKYILAERAEANKATQFERLLLSTGMYQNFGVDGYGPQVDYGDPLLYERGYSQELGQVGDTNYGYSGFSAAHVVSRGVDLTEYVGREEDSLEASASYHAQKSSDLNATVTLATEKHAEIVGAKYANEELRALVHEFRGALRELTLLRKVQAQSGSDVDIRTEKRWEKYPVQEQEPPLIESDLPVEDGVERRLGDQDALAAVVKIFKKAQCAACHSGDKAKGDFSIDHLAAYDKEDWWAIVDYLEPDSCPKKLENAAAAVPLTQNEKDDLRLYVLSIK